MCVNSYVAPTASQIFMFTQKTFCNCISIDWAFCKLLRVFLLSYACLWKLASSVVWEHNFHAWCESFAMRSVTIAASTGKTLNSCPARSICSIQNKCVKMFQKPVKISTPTWDHFVHVWMMSVLEQPTLKVKPVATDFMLSMLYWCCIVLHFCYGKALTLIETSHTCIHT